jgi:hypothetical protein
VFARISVFRHGVQSINRSGAEVRLDDISHPATTFTGGAGVIGLRAMGTVLAMQSCALRVEISSSLGYVCGHKAAVRQSDHQRGSGLS